MLSLYHLFVFIPLLLSTGSDAFTVRPLPSTIRTHAALHASASSTNSAPSTDALNEPEKRVYEIVKSLHDTQYTFRVVVVGKGAILETTTKLGPVVKISKSPSTGANLVTFASPDQSFEFHLQLGQVSKITLTQKETPAKVLRIIRLLNDTGEPMCSLILREDSKDAIQWYEQMISNYGDHIQL
jgi:hypothetical protein